MLSKLRCVHNGCYRQTAQKFYRSLLRENILGVLLGIKGEVKAVKQGKGAKKIAPSTFLTSTYPQVLARTPRCSFFYSKIFMTADPLRRAGTRRTIQRFSPIIIFFYIHSEFRFKNSKFISGFLFDLR